jgi:hypothetical protein
LPLSDSWPSLCDGVTRTSGSNDSGSISLVPETNIVKYSQTCSNDHLRTMTTYQQRPAWFPPNYFSHQFHLNSLQTATISLRRPLFWGPKGGCCTQVWLCTILGICLLLVILGRQFNNKEINFMVRGMVSKGPLKFSLILYGPQA